jgi:hypothetical protein
MIIAHERSNAYGELLKSVRGVMFFGVPHRGSDLAYWGDIAASICKTMSLGANTKFIAPLRRKSATFADISQQFIERGQPPLQIYTFYELNKVKGQLLVRLSPELETSCFIQLIPFERWLTKTRPDWVSRTRLLWGSPAPTIETCAGLIIRIARSINRLGTPCKSWWTVLQKFMELVLVCRLAIGAFTPPNLSLIRGRNSETDLDLRCLIRRSVFHLQRSKQVSPRKICGHSHQFALIRLDST